MLVRPALRGFGAIGAALSLSLVACSSGDDATSGSAAGPASGPTVDVSAPSATTTIPATTSTDANGVTTSTDATTVTDAPVDTTLVNVYWGSNVVNPPSGSPERIGAGAREVAADAPIRNALETMFGGVNSVERSLGMTTGIPPGTRVLGVTEEGATATVDLSSEFAAPGGTLEEELRLAQVVFVVTQFDGIDRVAFQLDGAAQDPILSHGFVVGEGLTRSDFDGLRPPILIEQPAPGAEVANPLVIRGESNTFEATVRYAITTGGGEGLVLTEGFTTATAGSGTWGTFEVIVDLSDFTATYQPGPGSIIMWEDSPRDGSQQGVVEIPIILPEL